MCGRQCSRVSAFRTPSAIEPWSRICSKLDMVKSRLNIDRHEKQTTTNTVGTYLPVCTLDYSSQKIREFKRLRYVQHAWEGTTCIYGREIPLSRDL